MPYVSGFDRNQIMMCSWDSFVGKESTARLIDAFVDSLNLSRYGVKEAAAEGRPAYDPKSLYKLYIYGNRKGIRSSRKLAESCRVNLEVRWMIGGVEPDFRTISDFRKDNIDSLKEIFHEFNRRISGAVEWGFTSVDGSKFNACCSRDANFTRGKLDDRIRWLNAHTDEYLREIDEMDSEEQRRLDAGEELPEDLDALRELYRGKLAEARERLEKYEGYLREMEESGAGQVSVTDPDARLMKSRNGFTVSYNPQTAVDSGTHLIRDYEMTNQVTDHGLLAPTMEGIREESGGVLEVVADKGYEEQGDMVRCLENGIIPNVIPDDGKDGYELEIPYEESDADTASTDPVEIGRCLHAGKVPEAYKDVIEGVEVREVRRKETPDGTADTPRPAHGTPEEMLERAGEGYFVRDPEANLVYCPNGETLRQKCIKKDGSIRYANKHACRQCPHRDWCYSGRGSWKEIDFTKDRLEKPCKNWPKTAGDGSETGAAAEGVQETGGRGPKFHYRKVKVVKFTFRPDRKKMDMRMCLSEHPFGTIKRAMGSTYFLLKGLRKVGGEFALFCLGYNFERAKNLLGFDKMMELMAGV